MSLTLSYLLRCFRCLCECTYIVKLNTHIVSSPDVSICSSSIWFCEENSNIIKGLQFSNCFRSNPVNKIVLDYSNL